MKNIPTIHKAKRYIEKRAFNETESITKKEGRMKLKSGEHTTINFQYNKSIIVPEQILIRGTRRYQDFKKEKTHRLRKSVTLILPNTTLIITNNEWKGIVKCDENKDIRDTLTNKIIDVLN